MAANRRIKKKDKWLGARIDATFEDQIIDFLNAKEMTMGDLVRRSVQEFMWSHPKDSTPTNNVE